MGRNKASGINIKFKSEGGVERVTGSTHILEIKVNNTTTNIMLDFGGVQEGKYTVKELFDINRTDLDLRNVAFAILSHGHFDHNIKFNQLKNTGFTGNVYMTDLTLQLTEHITLDGLNIHDKTVEYLNKSKDKVKPYMDKESREYFLDSVRAYGYNKWIELTPNIRFKFIEAGHISGASMIYIEVSDEYTKEYILYTGDTSAFRDIPFTKKPNIEKLPITQFISESTYGGQNIPQRKEKDVISDLKRIITNTCLNKKGDILIPSFAMARSTNLAYYLRKAYEKYPMFRDIPIYMVSPLMKKCHETILKNPDFYDDKWKEEVDLLTWDKIRFVTEYKEVLALGDNKEPCIMIASSGMGDNGVNAFLLPEKIRHKSNSIVFVGYCAENTIGYKILNKEQTTVPYNVDGVKGNVNINANIENLVGMSSHACSNEIIDMLMTANINKLKNVLLVHGDEERCELFSEEVKERLSNVNVIIPKLGRNYKL